MSKLGSKQSDTWVADLTALNGFVLAAQKGTDVTTFADGDATPDVSGSNAFFATNTSPTNITDFDSGAEGQPIVVFATNGNTTIVHDVTKIKLTSGANVTMDANTALAFTQDDGGVWWQVGGGAATAPSGNDPMDLIFFDDFMADTSASPTVGASGLWILGGNGSIGSQADNTDATAFGVWRFVCGQNVGADHRAMSPSDSTVFPLFWTDGMELGFRVRINDSLFDRGLFSVGLTDANLTSGNAQQGTVRAAFVIRRSDDDYFNSAGLLDDIVIFEAADASGGANYIFVDTGEAATDYSVFRNVKMIMNGAQNIDCYVDGVLIGSLTGTHVPDTSQYLALRVRLQASGTTNAAGNQEAFIDRIYMKFPSSSRGAN